MKLKSETKQVLEFLTHKDDTVNKPLLETCKDLNLNYDMICRALQALHNKGIIMRESRGPKSSYTYPTKIGLGDIIDAVEGIVVGNGYIEADLKEHLNSVRI